MGRPGTFGGMVGFPTHALISLFEGSLCTPLTTNVRWELFVGCVIALLVYLEGDFVSTVKQQLIRAIVIAPADARGELVLFGSSLRASPKHFSMHTTPDSLEISVCTFIHLPSRL